MQDRSEKRPASVADLIEKAGENGANAAILIPAASVVTASWVVWKCRYGCEDFGRTHTCPPHSPTRKETADLLQEYETALLIQADRSFRVRYLAYFLEREAFLSGYYKAFGMGAGPCRLCDSCDVRAPCRRPEEARPSMEACGIDVYATVRRHGLAVTPLKDENEAQHSFGLVLLQ
ncbi:MAG: DUF2284 domain-containing protein [Deltaproteobacteria bacterium]|nr:DUF2284 domain-containing protein [Deltaproteobacteria bacterium]